MKNTLTVAVLALAIGSAIGYYAPHFCRRAIVTIHQQKTAL
ncbi:hypothetical protein JCM19237_602 [Photobacterium aphoticum]|uniref:Uncharacterized protein n=1 Tax=Photobacterium aphoticum TaxID=754436 RepID=A0A090RD75_9GAMM|nr:hypothetical protein JCM19237_602 [Photobacterium aphoticum]